MCVPITIMVLLSPTSVPRDISLLLPLDDNPPFDKLLPVRDGLLGLVDILAIPSNWPPPFDGEGALDLLPIFVSV
jgi:hypothetical protein